MTDVVDEGFVSVLICTRGRGDAVLRAAGSSLACRYPAFEVIVVDQSDDDSTCDALRPLLSDPRLRYIPSPTKGKGVAANLGLSEAHGSIIAMTDDDCEVPLDWLAELVRSLNENPTAAIVYCNVLAAAHNSTKGFVPAYERPGDHLVHYLRDKCKARGIGAGMAFRKNAIVRIGGFDAMLGPGGTFHGCIDGDLTVRALLFGYDIFETDRVAVTHFGYRSFEEGRDQAYRSWTGIGAAYAKPLKAGRWRFLIVPAYELFAVALCGLISQSIRNRRPRGAAMVIGFVHGFVRGWLMRVDRRTLLFRPQQH